MDASEINTLQYCACFRLRAAARKVSKMYEDALRPVGLRVTQFTMLAMISGTKPDSITALAEDIGMDRTALNRALNIIRKNGWVSITGGDNQLEKKIRITKKGTKKLESAIPRWEAVQNEFVHSSNVKHWQEKRDWLIQIAGGKHYKVI